MRNSAPRTSDETLEHLRLRTQTNPFDSRIWTR